MGTWDPHATQFYFMFRGGKSTDVCAIAMLHTMSTFSIDCRGVLHSHQGWHSITRELFYDRTESMEMVV